MSNSETISLEELLEKDFGEYEDEKLISNIYYTSLRTSLREIEALKEKEPKVAESLIENNDWLFNETSKSKQISAINFDLLPKLLNISGASSPDALIINYKENEFNYLIEFKDCDKSTLIEKYLNFKSSDCIFKKFKDARKFILKSMCINDISVDDFVSLTHVVVVYNGKNNLLSHFPMKKTKKSSSIRNSSGKQMKMSNVDFAHNTSQNFVEESFGDEIIKLNFALCKENYFPIPGELKSRKMKPAGKVKNYSIFGKNDFAKIIDEYNFFDNCDWGTYTKFFCKT